MATHSALYRIMDCPRSERPSRLSVEPVFSPVASPKRKRDYDSDSDEADRSSGITRIRTALPSRPKVEEESFSPTSPRSKVSRQLHDLKLNKPDLTFTSAVSVSAFGQAEQAAEQAADSSGSWKTSSPPSEVSPEVSLLVDGKQIPGLQNLPVTPTLKPQAVAERIPLSPMPLPSPLPDPSYRPNYRVHTPPPESLPYQNNSSSPRKELWSPGELSNDESEDPADDSLGINGIGYKPTPAMAYARSQRRKQQVAEWKTREAKEARQRRMDRRRKILVGSEAASPTARRVRFVDG